MATFDSFLTVLKPLDVGVNTRIMKPTLVLLSIFCPLLLLAQTVDHFENGSSRWFVAESYGNANPQNPSFIETVTTVYGFQGDTLVSDEIWLKMYSTTDSSFSSNLTFEGIVRSTNGYVLFQETSSTADTLYNFNMNVGDSVLYNFYDLIPEYIEVIDVDSVEINGEMYKRLTFDEPQQPQAFTSLFEKWIEGIGSVHSPIFPKSPRVFSSEFPEALDLTCSHSNEILYWENEFYDQCLINIILGSSDIPITDFNVYPNPTTDRFFVRQEQGTGQFLIRDILGQQVLSGQLQSDNHTVDINNLKSGIYFVTVILDNSTRTKEIMKY